MDSFKEFEQKAWEKKAKLYEDNWGGVTRLPIERILEIAKSAPGQKLLDIGCGPGHLCYAADKSGAEVTGCDLSTQMIAIARANYPKITFKPEDAEKLSFLDSSFDIVTLNYLLLHVPDQKKVLLEALRVLKPNGLLIFTLWKEPSESKALKLIFDSIKKYADTSVIPPADDIFQFAQRERAERFLAASGLNNFAVETVETAWSASSAESFFNAVLSGTRMGGTIELQKEETREKIKTYIIQALKEFKTSSGYLIPMPSVITSARKSA